MMRWNETMRTSQRLTVTILTAVLLALAVGSPNIVHAQATITVLNFDSPGEGFNDTRPPDTASTAGGNLGSTLGAQRLIAFQYAADIWAGLLDSSEEIFVGANFNPLFCAATSATLGSAGTNTVHRDFTGAAVANTWYPAALANSLAGTDLAPGNHDINAAFNSAIGDTCSFPKGWYYGLNGNPPANTIDFVSIVLHELGHGLGFLTFVDLATGAKLSNLDDVFMLWLENHATSALYPEMTNSGRVSASISAGNLHWIGPDVVAESGGLTSGRHQSGHVEMYAPNPQDPGSSVSHFSTSLSPDELMEPIFTGANHDVGLAAALMQDIGWFTSLTSATTGAASSIDVNSATLNGTVRPNGTATIAYFEYGPTISYGSVTPATNVGSGTVDIPVSADIDGLEPGTTYHFRIVATNSSGTRFCADATFVTLAEYTLVVEPLGSGSVVRNPPGGNYVDGTTVTLTATGSGDGIFVGWEGAIAGVENPKTLTMNADKRVTATFVEVVLDSGIQFTDRVAIDPNDIAEGAGRPASFPYAMIEMAVQVAAPGDTGVVAITFPTPVPAGYNWYKYTSAHGWILFDRSPISGGLGDGAEFNSDRTQVTVYITDNGPYDDDPADGMILDPSGLGKTPVLYSPNTSSPIIGGGGGCFITTVTNDAPPKSPKQNLR
jgi:hypothetical protein